MDISDFGGSSGTLIPVNRSKVRQRYSDRCRSLLECGQLWNKTTFKAKVGRYGRGIININRAIELVYK